MTSFLPDRVLQTCSCLEVWSVLLLAFSVFSPTVECLVKDELVQAPIAHGVRFVALVKGAGASFFPPEHFPPTPPTSCDSQNAELSSRPRRNLRGFQKVSWHHRRDPADGALAKAARESVRRLVLRGRSSFFHLLFLAWRSCITDVVRHAVW